MMRLIKAFIVGATGLFIIITLFSLIIPSRVMVSRGIMISNASAAKVQQQIANFENWKNWHPIFTDDSARISRDNAIAGKDSAYLIVHRGRDIHIHPISADSNSVKFLLQASGENDIDNTIVISTISANSVQVEWRAITKLHWYPWEKFYGIFIDKITGPGYEAALNGLKDLMQGPLSPKGGT